MSTPGSIYLDALYLFEASDYATAIKTTQTVPFWTAFMMVRVKKKWWLMVGDVWTEEIQVLDDTMVSS